MGKKYPLLRSFRRSVIETDLMKLINFNSIGGGSREEELNTEDLIKYKKIIHLVRLNRKKDAKQLWHSMFTRGQRRAPKSFMEWIGWPPII